MIESGVRELCCLSWTGVVGPSGTPQPIVDKLNGVIEANLRTPELQAKLKALGAAPMLG